MTPLLLAKSSARPGTTSAIESFNCVAPQRGGRNAEAATMLHAHARTLWGIGRGSRDNARATGQPPSSRIRVAENAGTLERSASSLVPGAVRHAGPIAVARCQDVWTPGTDVHSHGPPALGLFCRRGQGRVIAHALLPDRDLPSSCAPAKGPFGVPAGCLHDPWPCRDSAPIPDLESDATHGGGDKSDDDDDGRPIKRVGRPEQRAPLPGWPAAPPSPSPGCPPPADVARQVILHTFVTAPTRDGACRVRALAGAKWPNVLRAVSARDYFGWSPLHYAALFAGCDEPPSTGPNATPNRRGPRCGAPETEAAWSRLSALLQAGADPGAACPSGRTPLHVMAGVPIGDDDPRHALLRCARPPVTYAHCYRLVAALVTSAAAYFARGAHDAGGAVSDRPGTALHRFVDVRDRSGRTALHWASHGEFARCRDSDAMALALACHGACPYAKGDDLLTPMDVAVRYRGLHAMSALVGALLAPACPHRHSPSEAAATVSSAVQELCRTATSAASVLRDLPSSGRPAARAPHGTANAAVPGAAEADPGRSIQRESGPLDEGARLRVLGDIARCWRALSAIERALVSLDALGAAGTRAPHGAISRSSRSRQGHDRRDSRDTTRQHLIKTTREAVGACAALHDRCAALVGALTTRTDAGGGSEGRDRAWGSRSDVTVGPGRPSFEGHTAGPAHEKKATPTRKPSLAGTSRGRRDGMGNGPKERTSADRRSAPPGSVGHPADGPSSSPKGRRHRDVWPDARGNEKAVRGSARPARPSRTVSCMLSASRENAPLATSELMNAFLISCQDI